MAKRKKRIKPLPIIIGSSLVVLLCLITSGTDREAITTPEILEKEEWKEEELVETLALLNVQRKRKGVREEVYRHLSKQVRKYPEPKRREIVKKSIMKTIDNIQKQWKPLEPEVRQKMIAAIKKEAVVNRKRIEKMSKERKARLKKEISKKETKEWIKTVNERAANRLSPDIRRDLSPVIKEWVDTLEGL
ncbi:MAG: hypothetical protein ACYTFY_15785 [Planctomycetota bacterium]|jgi:hypothetical protein